MIAVNFDQQSMLEQADHEISEPDWIFEDGLEWEDTSDWFWYDSSFYNEAAADPGAADKLLQSATDGVFHTEFGPAGSEDTAESCDYLRPQPQSVERSSEAAPVPNAEENTGGYTGSNGAEFYEW